MLQETGNGSGEENIEKEEIKATPYAWYVLFVLTLVYVLNFVDRQILSILATDIKRDLGISDADLGFLYGTAFGVFYATFGIPLGKLADSWNRTRLITAGLSLWSIMTAFSGLARNGVQLAGARVGVGIGEASAGPSAYSLISDWFPKSQRATALSIYASGLYLGGGLSLLIGSQVVERWNAAYPDGGPLGLVGWQAAFMAVGLPGLLLAILVFTLREPLRGQADGLAQSKTPAKTLQSPFRGFYEELFNTIPPLTLIGAWKRGIGPLITNIIVAIIVAALVVVAVQLTGGSGTSWRQFGAVGLGIYAVFSWGAALRQNDNPAFTLIWKTPAFLATTVGYGLIAFSAYAVSFWSAPYAETVLGETKAQAAIFVGAPGALAGFLGVIMGGRLADFLRKKNPAGRLIVALFGAIAPIVPMVFAFTTTDPVIFYVLNFLMGIFASTALGACAATTQDLVLPRMRGIATATFFIGTTLIGLAFGPYMAGYVSTVTGSLTTGMLSLLVVAPISIGALLYAYRSVPKAADTVIDRARAAGEHI